MKKGARRIGKGWKYRVTALAAVIFIVGSSLTTVYAAERRTLESTVEKKPRIMELERERKPELVKSMWKDMALAEEMKAVEMGSGEMSAGAEAAENAEPELTQEEKKAEAEVDAYFDNAVFVGDSIMLGFRNYAMKRQDTFLSRPQFLAAGSFSVNNALWPVDDKSVHPVYRGEQHQIWESIAMMGSKRVFLMLGMNDLNINGVEGTCKKYEELVDKIKETDPDAEINIMSMTYILHGKEVGMLQNDIIRQYNQELEKLADEKGWGFVDISQPLADENGDLAVEYCSDDFAHQRPEAYDVWVSVLRDYARRQLDEHMEVTGNFAEEG